MKPIVLFLLVLLCCSLLTVTATVFAPATKDNSPIVAAATQNSSLSILHHASGVVLSDPDGSSEKHSLQASMDSENEDDLLEKNSLLQKYVATFLYVYFTFGEDGRLRAPFPLYTFLPPADSHRYIRLRVFRI